MGMIDDILKALDRIPIWARLTKVPDEVDKLRERVLELESKLNGKWPADVCKFCGERAMRMKASMPNASEWKCQDCGKREIRKA